MRDSIMDLPLLERLNVPLMREVFERMREYPEQVDMSFWYTYLPDSLTVKGGCNTTACFAGWVVTLSDASRNHQEIDNPQTLNSSGVENMACVALNLWKSESDHLFFAGDWPIQFKTAYAEVSRKIHEMAVSRFDHALDKTQLAALYAERTEAVISRMEYFIETGL